uniref:Synaptojanin-2-binding protein n=1 Tax=Latimeria chalumnae TaxID=7897 RepID=H3ARI1_LATCH
MNGDVRYLSEEVEIQLKRGPTGLGFNIVGGIDQLYISKDAAIIVTKIKPDGAAHTDGRLQEGDKILKINEHDLRNITHQQAVELFRNAGDDVTLTILQQVGVVSGCK